MLTLAGDVLFTPAFFAVAFFAFAVVFAVAFFARERVAFFAFAAMLHPFDEASNLASNFYRNCNVSGKSAQYNLLLQIDGTIPLFR